MRRLVISVLVFSCAMAAVPGFASDKTEVVAAMHQYFDNLDPAKIDKANAMCDLQITILDEFPPHVWHGPNACADWWKGLNAFNDKEGITDASAALGTTPWTVDVSGDRAYFVSPATYTYKQHGKPVSEAHAVFTAALKKTSAGWHITAWTWSKH